MLSITLGVSFATCMPKATAQETARYEILAADGDVLGHSERTLRPRADGGYDVVTRREYLLREKDGPKRKIIDEKVVSKTNAGQVSSIRNHYTVGSFVAETLAEIDGSSATVTRRVKDDRREVVLELPDDLRFDNGAGLLKNWVQSKPVNLTFHVLDINAPAINRVTIQEVQSDSLGRMRKLLRKTYRDNALYGVDNLTLNRLGKLSASERQVFGTSIRLQPFDVEKSDSKLSPSSLISQVLVKSPVRIPQSARNGKIRYGFKLPDGVSFSPPQTGEQKVILNADGFRLDICDGCGEGLPTDPAYLSAASKAGFWLQSDHKKMMRFSHRIARKDISESDKMLRVARKALDHVDEIDFAGHVSALEALQRKSGDCTESAVLLAALGRSMGIPTRVASGIVYSREKYHGVSHTFMPHVWTLAYVDGDWKSFDMALDGFDTTHIAFTISDGDPSSIAAGHHLAGLVEWDGISEVRKRASN